jgi:hypothetical protein
MKKRIKFEDCDKALVEKLFKLKRKEDLPTLTAWLESAIPATDSERTTLATLLQNTKLRIDDWNEEGLKMNFIAPLLSYINFNTDTFTAFADERLSAEFDDFILSGKADWFVAKGVYKPETPYLLLHEYKKTRAGNSDPEGQLLAEMIVAKKHNDIEGEDMYGVVVTGRLWSFIVLTSQNEYALSTPFDSKNLPELYELFGVLKASKEIVTQKVMAYPH